MQAFVLLDVGFSDHRHVKQALEYILLVLQSPPLNIAVGGGVGGGGGGEGGKRGICAYVAYLC